MLEATGVSRAFGAVKALDCVDIRVERGETLGIIGPNGSGKTTFFNVLSGIERSDAGTVTFEGDDITGLRPHRVAERGIARTFQNLRLFAGMSALDNVIAGGHRHTAGTLAERLFLTPRVSRSEAEVRETALACLESVGLANHENNFATELSYGQTKRLELARALNTGPRILLLDEPTAGMNDAQARDILELVAKTKRDFALTLVIIEHNVPVLTRFVDRLVVLDAGAKLAEGLPEDVVRDPRVIEAYLGTGAA